MGRGGTNGGTEVDVGHRTPSNPRDHGGRTPMHLSDVVIRNTRPEKRPIKLFDGDGLYLLVNPNGSRLWRFKYRIAGREKLISFGSYPEVPLQAARDRREEARDLVARGGDPRAHRQARPAA